MEINVNDEFVCIKDYIMDSGEIAYTKWFIYKSEKKGCITDNQKSIIHLMIGVDSEFDLYFVKLINVKKITKEEVKKMFNCDEFEIV